MFLRFDCANEILVLLEAFKTKVSRNENLAKLQAGYLFPEVCISTGPFSLI